MSEKMTTSATDRRSFLKSGALVATPVVGIAVPAAAMADDGRAARLARLEDERAIDTLHRATLRRLNGGGADRCGEFFCEGRAPNLPQGLRLLADDPATAEAEIAFAEDGLSATCRRACRAEFETRFEGNTTLEQMARLQGHGPHRHSENRTLVTVYRKGKDGWAIDSLTLA